MASLTYYEQMFHKFTCSAQITPLASDPHRQLLHRYCFLAVSKAKGTHALNWDYDFISFQT